MTPTTNNRRSLSHRSRPLGLLRDESAQLRAVLASRRSRDTLPPTRNPLAALRRRLAGSASYA